MQNDVVPIKPVSKDLIYMKVADAIHNYIHVNHLQPGDKIPAERVLAEQLQTGRNSVREALRVLENEGIIEVKTGRGAFVTAQSSSDSLYLKLFKVNYIELLEIKTILEREVICRLPAKATDEQLDQMEATLVRVEEAATHGVYASAEDREFHKQMLKLSGNKTLEQMILKLIVALDDYAKVLENAEVIWMSTIPYHRQMLDAIRERNVEKACLAYDEILKIDLVALNTVARTD